MPLIWSKWRAAPKAAGTARPLARPREVIGEKWFVIGNPH